MRRHVFTLVVAFAVLTPVSARYALPAIDDFNRSASTLGSNWTGINGAITDWVIENTGDIGAHTAALPNSDFALASWSADSFTDNQYAQAVVLKGTFGYEGVCVRLSGSGATRTGYCAMLDSPGYNLYEWVSGTRTSIDSGSLSWVDGHTLKISVTSGTVTIYDNGSLVDTTVDGSPRGAGAAGIGATDDGGYRLTNFQADNEGGAPASFIPGIINAPVRGGGVRAFVIR